MSQLSVHWHPDIALHDRAASHVAMDVQRLELVAQHLLSQPWACESIAAPAAHAALEAVHAPEYLALLKSSAGLPEGQHLAFDGETRANRHTWRALSLSAGAWLEATRQALVDKVPAAFCVSYAGHHARRDRAAGFCLLNGVAVAAHHALALGAERIAVLDFDTHAGDGTVLALLNEPRALVGETYQPGFPGAFLTSQAREGILRFKTDQASKFLDYWQRIFDRVRAFEPAVVLVSAGFDAHRADPLSRIGVSDSAYVWLGEQLRDLHCPVVAGLEGGYNLDSTRRCAALFCEQLSLKKHPTLPA